MKTKYLFFIAGFFAGVVVLLILGYTIHKENLLEDSEKFPQNYKIISPAIPDELTFAGEEVPLENFEVRERVDREILVNTYWHSATVLGIKRANRWFPVIEPILGKYGIPDDFKYLAVIESGLANVVSPAGATGYWQFMEGAAMKYGLEVNDEIDERYHVEKSTEAACKYLKDSFEKFGSWTLAAASYNMGVHGVEKQLGKQKADNYYNLVLSDETSRYIARILAIREIMKHPEKFGFFIEEDDLYEPYKTYEVEVKSSVKNLADFAAQHEINYKTLKIYNPWLRDNFISNKSNKTYKIKLPEKGSIQLIN